MSDRLFFPALAAAALLMIALAAAWPQGLGDRSPGPFGDTPIQRTPEMRAALQREHETAQRRLEQARRAVAAEAEKIAPAK